MEPLILLVEDDPNILKLLKITLENNKYQVVMAENGKKGLKVLSELKNRPDLIISDILMPEMGGFDFFDAVSNDPAYCDVPFIFLSALDSPEDIRLGKILGADDYLTKPINEDDLLAIVAGKIKRSKKVRLINKKINEIYTSYKSEHDNGEAPMAERIKLASPDGVLEHIYGKHAAEPPESVDEQSTVLLILSEGGVPVFSYPFSNEWKVDEDLFSSFLSAFTSFSTEFFSKGLDRVKFGDVMMLMETIGSFSFCYLFKGQTYLAKQKLTKFIEEVQNNTSLWQSLEQHYKTNQILELKDNLPLGSLITKIFTSKS